MARGYFIHQAGAGLGVQAKIDSQVKVLSVLGEAKPLVIERTVIDKLRERLPLMGCDLESVWEQIVEPDFLYMRKWVTDRQTLEFLRRVRSTYPGCIMIIEVPTYPYDSEMAARPKDLPLLAKDRKYRRALNRYVDRVATFYGQREIFGIPTIAVTNGIDVDFVPPRRPGPKEPGRLDLIAVSTMTRQHGYDRVLAGMAEYTAGTPKRQVFLHLVGDGQEYSRYRRISRKCRLGDRVVFHGSKTGAALDSLYDYCDIGLVAFGMHRIGVDRVSALKTGEYLARGIPMVGGCPEVIFEGAGFPFYLEFPNDDSAIPIAEVVQFYEERVLSTPAEAAAKAMRQYAHEKCDMRVAMAPVIEYLAGGLTRS